MPQITLFAPDVTCDHCIATIQKAVGTVDGATFLEYRHRPQLLPLAHRAHRGAGVGAIDDAVHRASQITPARIEHQVLLAIQRSGHMYATIDVSVGFPTKTDQQALLVTPFKADRKLEMATLDEGRSGAKAVAVWRDVQ